MKNKIKPLAEKACIEDAQKPAVAGNRNATMYVSYMKDRVVSGRTPAQAIELIEQAKEAFRRLLNEK